MRRITVAVALLVLTPALVTSARASSATRECRHLITHPRGDAYMWFLPTRPYNAEADLLALDAATGTSTVDFTVTLASVNPKPVTGTTVAIYFAVTHQGGTAYYQADISHQTDGDSFSLQNDDTLTVTPIRGASDPARGTFVAHVPRAAIQSEYRGAVLSRLGVIVAQTVGVDLANGGFIEQSTGPGYRYRVGYPYCSRH